MPQSLDDFLDTHQPRELLALREHALVWMERLGPLRPHATGDVWSGEANRDSDIWLSLFCDDPKSAEITLIDSGVQFSARSVPGLHGEMVDALSVHALCRSLGGHVGVHLLVYDLDDVRGALQPDARGRRPRGDVVAVRHLLHDSSHD